jgi:hypothetical protein
VGEETLTSETGHFFDGARPREHSRLDGEYLKIGHDREDLGGHECGVEVVHRRHADSILSGYRGDRRRPVDAEGAKSAKVCLDSRSTTRIRASNSENGDRLHLTTLMGVGSHSNEQRRLAYSAT